MGKFKRVNWLSGIVAFFLCFSLITTPMQTFANVEESSQEENQNIPKEGKIDDAESDVPSSLDVLDENQTDRTENEDTDTAADESQSAETEDEKPVTVSDDDQLGELPSEEDELDLNDDFVDEDFETIVEDEEDEQDYSVFEMEITDITVTGNSITIHWSTSHDVEEEFILLLDGEIVDKVSGDTRSYTFTKLKANQYYELEVAVDLEDRFYYSVSDWEAPYWSEEELEPVSFILILNENLEYNEYIKVRGIDGYNEAFDEIFDIFGLDEDVLLPHGKFEVILYDEQDPSISAREVIEIKEGVDYIDNPIPLQFRLKEMREKAEPFEYKVSDVTGNSFSLVWNHVSKIKGFNIYGWDSFSGDQYIDLIEINNDLNEYTIANLLPNMKYDIQFIANYLYDIESYHPFSVKTDGEDADAPKVKFEDEKFKELVAEVLGIHLRDVTEADMNGLGDLWASYKNISSLEGIQYAHKLIDLDARGNEISDISALKNLHQLVGLDLGHNQIENIDVLKDKSKLEYLSLENNLISDISALEALSNLSSLRLDYNQITNIESLTNKPDLNYLSLEYNHIEEIPTLENLNTLEYLYLYANNISNIEGLASIKSLVDLHLSDNQISDITALSQLQALRYLNLDSNKIVNIDSLANLIQLESLNLGENKVTDLSALENLQNLSDLILYHNEVTDISPLGNLSNLSNLNLFENKIKDITALASLKNLQYLDLSQNEVTDLSALGNLQNLEALSIYNNNITDISPLAKLSNLMDLDLSGNNITDITAVNSLKNLHYLDLSYNDVTDITPLLELPKLQTLYLYGMEITDKETIQALRNDGVEVYDGDYDGDWNDWDDEDEDSEDEVDIDIEEVVNTFPADQGFVVSDDGKSITLDLSKQSVTETFELTPEQTELLIKNKQTINLEKDEVKASIPASSFDNYDEPVTININEVESDPNSLSSTYDFTIKQGTRTISQFEEGITLTFNVNAERAKNPKNLKVFYFNEEKQAWENIGGSYSNGTVTVVTSHFSIFTVFEAADENSNEIVELEDEMTPPTDEDELPADSEDDNASKENDDTEQPADNEKDDDSDKQASGDEKESSENEKEENKEPGKKESDDATEESGKKESGKETEEPGKKDSDKEADADQKTTEVENSNKDIASSDTEGSKKLPNTATSIFTVLLIGLLLIVFGITLLYFNRKKAYRG